MKSLAWSTGERPAVTVSVSFIGLPLTMCCVSLGFMAVDAVDMAELEGRDL
jgi:hypothetical protein